MGGIFRNWDCQKSEGTLPKRLPDGAGGFFSEMRNRRKGGGRGRKEEREKEKEREEEEEKRRDNFKTVPIFHRKIKTVVTVSK